MSVEYTGNAQNTIGVPRVAEKWRTQWKRWIMTQLGAPVVKVELTEGQVDEAIDSAVRIFSQWGYTEEQMVFIARAKRAEYNLPEMIPEYLEVREVIYSPSQAESLLQGFFTDFSFDSRQFFWYHSTYASMTDYAILNMYNEMYLRTIGNEGQWEVVGDKLILSPIPDRDVCVGITYTAFPKDIDIRRDEWIRSWALSECKMILGRIRSKFSSIPGPRGDISMDGDALITEAKEEQEKLRERLDEYIVPALFSTG